MPRCWLVSSHWCGGSGAKSWLTGCGSEGFYADETRLLSRFGLTADGVPLNKLIHQARWGPLSLLGIDPFQRYYGNYATPPDFLIMLGQYLAWTDDRATVRELLPVARKVVDPHTIPSATTSEASGRWRTAPSLSAWPATAASRSCIG